MQRNLALVLLIVGIFGAAYYIWNFGYSAPVTPSGATASYYTITFLNTDGTQCANTKQYAMSSLAISYARATIMQGLQPCSKPLQSSFLLNSYYSDGSVSTITMQ